MYLYDTTWFLKIDDSELGPFRIEDLQKMLDTGELDPSDLVRQASQTVFSPVRTFDVFRLHLPKDGKAADGNEMSIFLDNAEVERTLRVTPPLPGAALAKEVQQAEKIAQRAQKEHSAKSRPWRRKIIIAAVLLVVLSAGFVAYKEFFV